MHSFLYTRARIDAPARLEAHYARNKRNNEWVIGDHFSIFLDPLLPWNPNNGAADGSIPTFDEKVSFFRECSFKVKLLKVPIVKNLPIQKQGLGKQ